MGHFLQRNDYFGRIDVSKMKMLGLGSGLVCDSRVAGDCVGSVK